MATEAGAPATPTTRITRDRQGLLDALTVIDSKAGEGSTSTALLACVRTQIVRQLAIDAGLRGAAASQTEATGRKMVASTARRIAYPNAYPNGNPSGRVREHPRATPRGPDLHRRTRADASERISGP